MFGGCGVGSQHDVPLVTSAPVQEVHGQEDRRADVRVLLHLDTCAKEEGGVRGFESISWLTVRLYYYRRRERTEANVPNDFLFIIFLFALGPLAAVLSARV